MFECHATDDDWPPTPTLRRAYYVHPCEPGSAALVETEERDFDWLLLRHGG